jgi:low temperature requirement protein LtrA
LRALVAPHAIGFTTGLAIWMSSLAFAAPARYVLWGCALAVDLATGLVVYLRGADVPRHRSHMPERFGLFTLIVLGESIIAVSAGTARSDWALNSAATAALGFVLAAALWWLYFSDFDERVFDWALAGGTSSAGAASSSATCISRSSRLWRRLGSACSWRSRTHRVSATRVRQQQCSDWLWPLT